MNDFDHKIIFNDICSCIEKCDWCFCEKDVVKECGFSSISDFNFNDFEEKLRLDSKRRKLLHSNIETK